MKKQQLGECTLYCGDSLDIMADLIKQEIKADCLVCDPPYLLTSGGKSDALGGCLDRKNYGNDGKIVDCEIDWVDFMPLFFDIMARGHAYVMCNNRHIQNMLVSAQAAGFNFHNMLLWDKGNATPNRWYMKNCEFTGLFYKGKAKFINDCGSKALIKYPWTDESDHPTEKPVPLMEHYITNSTTPGQLVIDPFMGSGTTGVACVRTGRKFIGIELDEGHFETCVKRMQAALDMHQPALF